MSRSSLFVGCPWCGAVSFTPGHTTKADRIIGYEQRICFCCKGSYLAGSSGQPPIPVRPPPTRVSTG